MEVSLKTDVIFSLSSSLTSEVQRLSHTTHSNAEYHTCTHGEGQ